MVNIVSGVPAGQEARAAQLYWAAFSGKLGFVMGPPAKALRFLECVLRPDYAISALDPQSGQILGLAGFKTADGALIGGGLRDLAQVYGWLAAAWRGPVLSMLERALAPNVLLMDGIMVAPEARGQGIGTKLLDAVKAEALQRGCTSVRLDVIDTNPRARALYERQGFVAGDVETLGPLSHVFGFKSATQMMWNA